MQKYLRNNVKKNNFFIPGVKYWRKFKHLVTKSCRLIGRRIEVADILKKTSFPSKKIRSAVYKLFILLNESIHFLLHSFRAPANLLPN